MLKDNEDFYNRLENQLLESSEWPNLYMFKFILKSDNKNVIKLKTLFKEIDTEISTKLSSSDKFTSVTIKAKMKSPSLIIKKYKLAAKIEGIISL
jgi:hypothetical protein|tara:strand:+ start:1754 stop:2038 length:285 start_codon:yes stop_codon:yes gene_type:complete